MQIVPLDLLDTAQREEAATILRTALAHVESAPATAWAEASDPELDELVRITTGLRQAAERHAALGAGEVVRRSDPDHGSAGFAQRAGHRTVEEFLRARTGVSGRDAATTARVGALTVAGGVVGDALRDGRVSVASADAIRAGLGAPNDAVPAAVLDQAARRLCEEAAALGELFSFHPLALEDMLKRNQRPKLEDYGDFMFLVYYAAHAGEWGIELDEVHAFLSGGYLVTVHQGACRALEEARERLSAQAPRSEQFVVYRVLDGLTDTFFPVLDTIDEEIERAPCVG